MMVLIGYALVQLPGGSIIRTYPLGEERCEVSLPSAVGGQQSTWERPGWRNNDYALVEMWDNQLNPPPGEKLLDKQITFDGTKLVAVHRFTPITEADAEAQRAMIPSVTRRQLILGLLGRGVLTPQEAIAAAKTGDVPTAIQTVFNALPSDQRTAAEITWASMSIAERNNPLVNALAAANGWSATDVDAFFAECYAL